MKKNGFTLIELIATIVIMALILLLVMPAITALQNNNKDRPYEYYADSLIEAAKIYVTREGEDITSLGTLNFTGCVDISYTDLLNADLIHEFDEENIDCSNAKIRYTKTANKESYTYNLTCRDTKTNEVVYNANNIANNTCTVTAS